MPFRRIIVSRSKKNKVKTELTKNLLMENSNIKRKSNSYETSLATLEIDTNEVLTLTLKPIEKANNLIEQESLEQELNRIVSSQTYGVPKLQLIDIRASWNTTQADIRMLVNQDALVIPYARAVIIPIEANPISIHAILMMSKIVKYPIRFFTSKSVAYDWLMSFHTPTQSTAFN